MCACMCVSARVCIYVWVCVCVCMYIRVCIHVLRILGMYEVATISRLPKNIGLFCKRAVYKRLYSAKETCILKSLLITATPYSVYLIRVYVYMYCNIYWECGSAVWVYLFYFIHIYTHTCLCVYVCMCVCVCLHAVVFTCVFSRMSLHM